MKQITNKTMCVLMRSGIEIWVNQERAEKISNLLGVKNIRFLDIGKETINSADVSGIFSAKTMEDVRRRKNGQWQCDLGTWHQRGEKCVCGELNKYPSYSGVANIKLNKQKVLKKQSN